MKKNFRELLSITSRCLRAWFKLEDLVFLAAACSLGYGIYQIHRPAAFIVLGVLFLVLTVYGRLKS